MHLRHTNNYRVFARGLVVFVIFVCFLSFYLTAIDYNVSGESGMPHSHRHGRLVPNHHSHHHAAHYHGLRRSNPITTTPTAVISTTIKFDNAIHRWFSPLPQRDATNLRFNDHPIFNNYILSNYRLCKDKKIDMLIYFHSAVNHFEQRRALRETWASRPTFRDLSIERVFLIGQPTSPSQQMSIVNEQTTYTDLIQGDFVDSAKNLTYKAIMAVKWISQFCPHARYVVKADDDIFVNIFSLVETVIPKLGMSPVSLACRVRPNGTSTIVRNPRSKWWVPDYIYPGKKYFPTFCPGFIVVFSGDLAPIMYKSTYSNPFFGVDDVYLFGMSIERVKRVKFVDISSQIFLNPDRALEQLRSDEELTFVASPVLKPEDQTTFWLLSKKRLSAWAKSHIRHINSGKQR